MLEPRLLFTLTKTELLSFLPYRTTIIFLSAWSFVDCFVFSFLWLTASQNISMAYSRPQIAYYFFFLSITAIITNSWCNFLFSNDLKTGKTSYFLLRPYDLMLNYAGNNIGQKLAKLLTLLPLWGIWLIVLVYKFGARDIHLWNIAMFSLVLILSGALVFLMDYCIALLSFWILETRYLYIFVVSIMSLVFGGYFIPIGMWPTWFQKVLFILPFHFQFSFPVEVSLGNYSPQKIFLGILLQFFWITAMILTARKIFTQGVAKNPGFGG